MDFPPLPSPSKKVDKTPLKFNIFLHSIRSLLSSICKDINLYFINNIIYKNHIGNYYYDKLLYVVISDDDESIKFLPITKLFEMESTYFNQDTIVRYYYKYEINEKLIKYYVDKLLMHKPGYDNIYVKHNTIFHEYDDKNFNISNFIILPLIIEGDNDYNVEENDYLLK